MGTTITNTFTIEYEEEIVLPDVSNLVTEDDTPVDNLVSERQMRLLSDSGYASWPGPGDGRTFVVLANVALYAMSKMPPLVPDVMLILDVTLPEDPWPKEKRPYFIWEYGKPPEIVIEIVSNRKGNELGNKLLDYARVGVAYYVVFDPQKLLSDNMLRIFARRGTGFEEIAETWFEDVGIGVTLWEGDYQGLHTTWLRWCDRTGAILPTGAERAERLAAQLRAHGVEPEA